MIKLSDLIKKQHQVISEGNPDVNADGIISPKELHDHFDVNGDGKVDLVDYAAHILFHIENPQYLQQYRAAAAERLVQSPLAARMNKFSHRAATPGPSTFTTEN